MNAAASSSSSEPTSHEEPEITQEEAVPSDGRDVEGEKLMQDVQNEKLEPSPGQEKQKHG